MKKNIVLFLLLISNLSFSQSFLYMIENEIKKGNLEIAKKQIAVLNNNNHHFCGNAEAKFKADIGFLKSKIAIRENNYDKSLKILNSIENCVFGGNCEKRDSLKIETLFLKYGTDKIINSFKNKKELKVIRNKHFQYKVHLEDINYDFIFFSNGYQKDYEHPKYGTVSTMESNDNFNDMCKNLKFYNLIK